MNKWQLICPLTALTIVIVYFSVVSASRHRRAYIAAHTEMIDRDPTNTIITPHPDAADRH